MPLLAQDTVTITNATRTAVTNQPVSIARVFVQGEIAQYVTATVGATTVTTQCDVKNRWPDGSVKFAIVSFVIPGISANRNVTVTFSNQSTGNNTGYLTPANMLSTSGSFPSNSGNWNFDGQIQLTGTASHNISARTILTAANSGSGCITPTNGDIDGALATTGNLCAYWLQGSVVTAVILEDRLGRGYDVNTDGSTGNPLHPIFEAWFYPQTGQVEIGYMLEDEWASATASTSARDQTYSYVLTAGSTGATNVYACGTSTSATNSCGVTTPETVLTRTRWHHRFCANGTGLGKWNGCENGVLNVNFNWAYLAKTRILPNWDPAYTFTTTSPPNPTPKNFYAAWTSTNTNKSDTIDTTLGLGFFPGTNTYCGGSRSTTTGDGCTNSGSSGFDNGGMAYYHGPLTTWNITTLISQDPNMINLEQWSADAAGGIPYWFREADTPAQLGASCAVATPCDTITAATSLSFDFPNNTVSGQGRVISVNDRFEIDTARVTLTQSGSGKCAITYPSQFVTYGGTGQVAGNGEDLGQWSLLSVAPQLDTSHWPETSVTAYLLTGRYNYYEQVLMQAAYGIASAGGSQACFNGSAHNPVNTIGYRGPRQGQIGYGNWEDGDRTMMWNLRQQSLCASLAWDGSPEQAYCLDKMRTTLAMLEGSHNIPCDLPTGTPVQVNYCGGTRNGFQAAWSYGQAYYTATQEGGSVAGQLFSGTPAYSGVSGATSCGTGGPAPPNCTVWASGNSALMNGYSGVMLGWINDQGFCPTINNRCQLLQFMENFYINMAMDPNGPGALITAAFTVPSFGCSVTITTPGNNCTGTLVPITNLGCASQPCTASNGTGPTGLGSLYPYMTSNGKTGYGWPFNGTGIANYWYCGDEGYAAESAAAASYGATMVSTANQSLVGTYAGAVGFSGTAAFNKIYAVAFNATQCVPSYHSPKWHILPSIRK
jgi:hypothetical protein